MALKVKTNIDPEYVHETLLKTFEHWVSFALGEGKLGGKVLSNPSGRYASAIKANYDENGYIVGIYLDRNELRSGGGVGQGHKRVDLKRSMLQAGKPGVRKSKEGYLYRYVPISDKPQSPFGSYVLSNIKNMFVAQDTGDEGGILRFNKNLAKMWTANYRNAHTGSTKVRTMSNKPGAAKWVIPSMPAFNIRKLLKDMVPANLRNRIQV